MPCRDHKKGSRYASFFVVPFSPSPQKRRPPVGALRLRYRSGGAFVASIFFENQRAGRDPAPKPLRHARLCGPGFAGRCSEMRFSPFFCGPLFPLAAEAAAPSGGMRPLLRQRSVPSLLRFSSKINGRGETPPLQRRCPVGALR